MKKTLLVGLGLVTVLFACSNEMTKEEKEQKFKEVGQTYMTKKIATLDDKKRDGVETVELLKIDSMQDLNEQSIYQIDLNLKYAEWNRQITYANELVDIEKGFGVGESESTLHEFEKADQMAEELKQMETEKKKKSKKKIGDIVFFLTKLVNEDGSTRKATLPIAFNNDLTVSAEVMDKFWK